MNETIKSTLLSTFQIVLYIVHLLEKEKENSSNTDKQKT